MPSTYGSGDIIHLCVVVSVGVEPYVDGNHVPCPTVPHRAQRSFTGFILNRDFQLSWRRSQSNKMCVAKFHSTRTLCCLPKLAASEA